MNYKTNKNFDLGSDPAFVVMEDARFSMIIYDKMLGRHSVALMLELFTEQSANQGETPETSKCADKIGLDKTGLLNALQELEIAGYARTKAGGSQFVVPPMFVEREHGFYGTSSCYGLSSWHDSLMSTTVPHDDEYEISVKTIMNNDPVENLLRAKQVVYSKEELLEIVQVFVINRNATTETLDRAIYLSKRAAINTGTQVLLNLSRLIDITMESALTFSKHDGLTTNQSRAIMRQYNESEDAVSAVSEIAVFFKTHCLPVSTTSLVSTSGDCYEEDVTIIDLQAAVDSDDWAKADYSSQFPGTLLNLSRRMINSSVDKNRYYILRNTVWIVVDPSDSNYISARDLRERAGFDRTDVTVPVRSIPSTSQQFFRILESGIQVGMNDAIAHLRENKV